MLAGVYQIQDIRMQILGTWTRIYNVIKKFQSVTHDFLFDLLIVVHETQDV